MVGFIIYFYWTAGLELPTATKYIQNSDGRGQIIIYSTIFYHFWSLSRLKMDEGRVHPGHDASSPQGWHLETNMYTNSHSHLWAGSDKLVNKYVRKNKWCTWITKTWGKKHL